MRRIGYLGVGVALVGTLVPGGAPAGPPVPVVGSSFAPTWGPDALPLGDLLNPPASTDPTRTSGTDQPDVLSGNQTHAIYFVPTDKPDQNLDTDGRITRAIDGIRAWFSAQMGRRPRFDSLGTGGWDITYVRGRASAAEYLTLGSIADELQDRGFNQSGKRYLVYAAIDRGSICGEGYFPVVAETHRQFHAVYLDSSTDCGARSFGDGTASGSGKSETIAVQEWLHNDGIVSPGAPHHCVPMVFHVCTGPLAYLPGEDPEELDVAFPFVTHKLGSKKLDLGRDDYLDHSWPHLSNLRDSPWLEPA